MTEPDLPPDPRARRRAAFHEAGHAIVAWALGLEVGWVRLLPETENSAGKIDRQTADHLPPEDQIAVLMGSWWSTRMCDVPQLYPAEFEMDEVQTFIVVRRTHPDDDDAQEDLRDRGIARAQELVMRHAESVVLIAEELERRGELLAGEVARLLTDPGTPAAS
jgi:ATP-dependent Zn protease